MKYQIATYVMPMRVDKLFDITIHKWIKISEIS